MLNALRFNTKGLMSSKIDINKLQVNKLFVYNADKKSLAYIFNNCGQACCVLTPVRCKKLSDLTKNKNLQHIRRVINKGTVSKTEIGQFYIFANPSVSTCLDLVVWGANLQSTVGTKLISKQERERVALPNFHLGVIIGLLLSDGWLTLTRRSVNRILDLKQSLAKSSYVWFVFTLLSHYCSSYPFLVTGTRYGVKFQALQI